MFWKKLFKKRVNKNCVKSESSLIFLDWKEYYWNDRSTHPDKPGRYLVYRRKCNKQNFMQWNGNGWASDDNTITHYCKTKPPTD